VEYLCFQGGDFPPLPNCCVYTTLYYYAPTTTIGPTGPSPTSRVHPVPVPQVLILESHQDSFVGCIRDGPPLAVFPLAAIGTSVALSSLLLGCAFLLVVAICTSACCVVYYPSHTTSFTTLTSIRLPRLTLCRSYVSCTYCTAICVVGYLIY